MKKILFVGHTWKGSSARSLREALTKSPDVFIDEVGEDHYVPIYRHKILRAFNRILKPLQITDLEREISAKLRASRPEVLMVYKGSAIRPEFINRVKEDGIFTVNVFPDQSPHLHGQSLKQAMGVYDLVVSTKPFHPSGWQSIYGYSNKCEFVPHGYDPEVHYWPDPPNNYDLDVVLAASWRPEYHQLMLEFSELISGKGLRVGLAGNGWQDHRSSFPSSWLHAGPLYGRAYGDFVRRGKIVIAPVHTRVVIGDIRQPGDEDTTRTYELASAFCFFLHRRTPFAQKIYNEDTEVPMWETAKDLAQQVIYYLPRETERRAMAAAAHARAVPSYSIPSRAQQVLELVCTELAKRKDYTS